MKNEQLTVNKEKRVMNNEQELAQREMRLWGMSNVTINYLLTKAMADHKTPEPVTFFV